MIGQITSLLKVNWKKTTILFSIFGATTILTSELRYALTENPKGSFADYYRKKFYGNAYRNYKDLEDGVYDFDDFHPKGAYISQDFSFETPSFLFQPGLEISERIEKTRIVNKAVSLEKKIILKDRMNQCFVIDTKSCESKLEENEQSKFTPGLELLKGCSYRLVEKMMAFDSFNVKKLEEIDKKMVLMIYQINNKKRGSLWFIHNGSCFQVDIISEYCDIKKELVDFYQNIQKKKL